MSEAIRVKIGDSITIFPANRSSTVGQITAIDGQRVYVEVLSRGLFPWLTRWEGWLTLHEREGLSPCAVARQRGGTGDDAI